MHVDASLGSTIDVHADGSGRGSIHLSLVGGYDPNRRTASDTVETEPVNSNSSIGIETDHASGGAVLPASTAGSLPRYEDKRADYFDVARKEMLEFVPASARNILEVGCGSGHFARLLMSRGAVVTGIEPFAAAAMIARGHLQRVIERAAEDGIGLLGDETFDCVVFNDVLEHLVDPGGVLRGVGAHLAPGGTVVASIPNLRYFPVLRDLVLGGDFRYADKGVLDRTHLRFFTERSIGRLFDEAGYRVVRVVGINPLHPTWKRRVLEWASRGSMQDTRFMQFAVVATV